MKKSLSNTIIGILIVLIFVSVITYVVYASINYVDNNPTIDIYKKYYVNPIEYKDNRISGLKDEVIEIKVNNLLVELDNDTNCEVTFNYSNIFAVACDKHNVVIDLTRGNLLNLQDIFRTNFNLNEVVKSESYKWGLASSYFWVDDGTVTLYSFDKYLSNIVVFDKYLLDHNIFTKKPVESIYSFEDYSSDYYEYETKERLFDIKVFDVSESVNKDRIVLEVIKFLNENQTYETYNYVRVDVHVNENGNYNDITLDVMDAKTYEFNNFVSTLYNNYENAEVTNIAYNHLYYENNSLSYYPEVKDLDKEKLSSYFKDNNIEEKEYTIFLEDKNNRYALYDLENNVIYIDLDYFVDK